LQRKSHHKDQSLEESSDEATWFFVMNNILFIKPTLTPPPSIDVRFDLKGYWLYRKVRQREWTKAEPEFLEWEFNNPANEGRLFPRGIVLDPHSYKLLVDTLSKDAQVGKKKLKKKKEIFMFLAPKFFFIKIKFFLSNSPYLHVKIQILLDYVK
jgi:hypothetical protein